MAALFLPCAGGVEALLVDEIARISGAAAEAARGGAWVEGDERLAMQLNLESRLAQRVLWPLAEGPYRDEHDLYALARRVDWTLWITPEQTLRVDVSAQRSPLTSLNFAALRIKDAVCDALREARGARPSVDTRHPDLPLALFVGPDHAMIYADLSGEALFKRGWREDKGEAPLKETLAAAMLAAAGWQGRAEDGPLFDPCCGAGTIVIEAAQIACGIAPGGQRRFAFERLLPFRPHLPAWRELQQDARARVHASAVPIHAGDVSFRLTDFATRNAERAGVAQSIEFKTADALQRPPPAAAGTLMLNPPYGERIAPKGQGSVTSREGFEGGGSSAEFFGALAAHWKRQYPGWTAWLLSPDMKLPSLMRLKESRRVPLWNGGIECRMFRFDLVSGAGPR
ncbi:MAG: class I SAM-dependent RNA methyltransferase [Burkholderiales bacterium]|nr:class I SAM-dependent RNA methyltransferase [Burkholderiales bacterium]MDE1928461.1 class I SAM-dependent RNA methyltransferase [Burkholderiales bacterium]MDE2159765.1 class I SAM-dependent RNA methyltransferase [Burkholderiales bacterium]MDE2502818.1 class I SAM-dependent RNA methyltransferase [Burkholderiales bacterium]